MQPEQQAVRGNVTGQIVQQLLQINQQKLIDDLFLLSPEARVLNLLTVKHCQRETSSNSSFPVAEVFKVSLLTDQQLLTLSWIRVL